MSFYKSCSRLNRKTMPIDIPEALYTLYALTSLFTPCMECYGDASCLRIPIDREESNVRKDKRITMAQ